MAVQPEIMKRKTDTPSLFDRPARAIPVGTVSQVAGPRAAWAAARVDDTAAPRDRGA